MVVVRNEQRAGLSVEAIRKRVAEGVHPAAGPRARLEDRHIVARLRQLVSRDQPGQSGPEDDDLLRRARLHEGRVGRGPGIQG